MEDVREQSICDVGMGLRVAQFVLGSENIFFNLRELESSQLDGITVLNFLSRRRRTVDDRGQHEELMSDGKWPMDGSIEFDDVHMKYRDTMEPSIVGLSFTA